jgi:2-succinyl-5-enolpyruvyl-6-hydroxy-3-cyclohexene-1-carboxylate synthase
MKPMNNPLRWASELINSLCKHGVSHAVISPGSRSTPLTLAAAIHPGIQNKVVLDERSAAFIALGIGKATGRPAALICTSGTAAANYFPAIIEAKASGVPMLVLSADRPPSLRNLGSSQTIDQLKLFGDHAVFFHEAGEPNMTNRDIRRMSYLGKQAVDASIKKGGAAHINLPFRKPLEPVPEQLQEEINRLEKHPVQVVPARTGPVSSVSLNDKAVKLIASSKKVLIIAGPAQPHQALRTQLETMAAHLNAPVIAEPGSGMGALDHSINRYEQFLRNPDHLNQLTPDLIIRFGDQPFTKSLLTALENWSDIPVIHFSGRDSWQDHAMSVSVEICMNPEDKLNPDPIYKPQNSKWLQLWETAEKDSKDRLHRLIEEDNILTDGHVFEYLSNHLSENWQVMISNSFPVRDMALFGHSTPLQFANRGAAGIDGITSTALGIHLAGDRPTCCITGDLAFLHDASALYSLQDIRHPFVIVVINNGGGTIFRMLPVHRKKITSAKLFETYFETPQNVEVRQLAKASGLSYHRIETVDELSQMNLRSFSDAVVVECRTGVDASMNLRQKLWNG